MIERRYEQAAVVSAVVGGLALLVNFALTSTTHLLAPAAVIPFDALVLATGAVLWLRLRLLRRAEEERQDSATFRNARPAGSLFTHGIDEAASEAATRSSDILERIAMPLFAPALAVLAGLGAWWMWRKTGQLTAAPTQHLLAAAFLAGETFILFVLGRFLFGLSHEAGGRLLRGAGLYTSLAALAALLGTVSVLVVFSGWTPADRVAGLLLPGILALVAAELLLSALFSLYRVGVRREPLTTYESRLARLLTDPGVWTRSVARTLDYQFGFKVSESWLYRFLARALIPLLLFQAITLYALTAVVFIGPDEEGILERFGVPRQDAWHLQPGAHFKWPWPFETVRRLPAGRILRTHIGWRGDNDDLPSLLVWTVPHFREEDHFLTASRLPGAAQLPEEGEASVPVNLVAVNVPIEYRITNLLQYAYRHADPRTLIEQAAARAMTLEAATHDLFDLLGSGQLAAAERLRERLRHDVDALELGVEIVFCGLSGVHPPTGVADSFEQVIGALEEKEATIHNARGYAARLRPISEARAAKARLEATAYRDRRSSVAAAEAAQFEKRLDAHARSPRVFRSRMLTGALQDALGSGARKFIVVAEPEQEVLIFNFEEKLRPDLIDLLPTSAVEKTP